jgi:hypothetical protein
MVAAASAGLAASVVAVEAWLAADAAVAYLVGAAESSLTEMRRLTMGY